MKRITIIPVLALITLLVFSCNKKDGAKPSTEGGKAAGKSAENYGYVLRVNAAFYTIENNTGEETDKTKWAASMALGEKVIVGKTRKATFSGDGKVYDFTEVRRDTGGEGFAFASQVADGGSLAVVTDEKAILYKSAKAVDATSTILSRKTVLVCFPQTESGGYIEIKAYDPEAQTYYKQNFIRTSSISRKEEDIQSSILLQTALPLKTEGSEKIRRDTLLESALLDYPNSAFSADIQALVNPNTSAVIKTEPASRRYMSVNDDNVAVRDLPDPVAGRIIGQLNQDDEVMVKEQTAATYTIGNKNERWYHINDPMDGWVYGGFLE